MNPLIKSLETAFSGYNNVCEFTLKKSETVDRGEVISIVDQIYNEHVDKFPKGYDSLYDSLSTALDNTGTEWLNRFGKFTKRLLKLMPELSDFAGILGDEITRKAYRSSEYSWLLSITDQIFWKDGNFGKNCSCWWGGGTMGESREVFIDEAHGIGLLWHYDRDPYNGIGRVWIAPIDEYIHSGLYVPLLFLFNQYGYSDNRQIRIDDTAQLLTQIIPETVSLDGYLNNDNNDEVPYINGNCGKIIRYEKDDILRDGYSIKVQWGSHDRYTCEECGNRINEDNVYHNENGDPYCNDCYNENYTSCNHCGNEVYRDDAITVDYNDYCQRCFDRYFFTCSECGESYNNDDAYNTDDGTYCESCYHELYTPCYECGDDIRNEDLTIIDNNVYCESCAAALVERTT